MEQRSLPGTLLFVELKEQFEALVTDVGAVLSSRDAVLVEGPDAVDYLQGQLSADIGRLSAGRSTDSLLLQPQGKLDVWLRATKLTDDAVLLDTEHGFGNHLRERIVRFLIRMKVEVSDVTTQPTVMLRGPKSRLVAGEELYAIGFGDCYALVADWHGWPGVDLIGPKAIVPEGVVVCPVEAYEPARIERGLPRMGSELDQSTIAAEAGLVETSVSFTKGCYVGQELIARIDARGDNVARHLRLIVTPDETEEIRPGVEVFYEGAAVGAVTSCAWHPQRAAWVSLAYIHRSVPPIAVVTVASSKARVPSQIESFLDR